MRRGHEFEQSSSIYGQKRVLAVHDLSSYGTTSLGIVLPILTTFGHETIILPSVILSSTTDIDNNPVTLDTNKWISKTMVRWSRQEIIFNAIYTGWLGSPKQIDILTNFFGTPQCNTATIFVDPILGDHGRLYPHRKELAKNIGTLAASAHVITPNPTEGAYLLKRQPSESGVKEDGTIDAELAEDMVVDLSTTFPNTLVVMKSVVWQDEIGVCVRFTTDNTSGLRIPVTETIMTARIRKTPVAGTGDLFTSLLIGHWLKQELGKQSSQHEKLGVVKWSIEAVSSIIDTMQHDSYNTLPFRSLLYIVRKYSC